MNLLKHWTNIKRGVLSLSLLGLAGCSTQEVVKYQQVKPNLLICPQTSQCQIPPFQLNNNGDLVLALDRSLTVIELCQIEIQAWEDCVENYNKLNSNEK